MAILLVGFDSAWTAHNSGALAGVLRQDDGSFRELGPPRVADFDEAERIILGWQENLAPSKTFVLLDQPTIVKNPKGQRPVENIVSSPVSLRYGGMQPASTLRVEMFGESAPIWPFLNRFGGPADPLKPLGDTLVFETYPVLAMIALQWALPDRRTSGRLPKYNPERRKTFAIGDWEHVCRLASRGFLERGIRELSIWLDDCSAKPRPRKTDQDCVDACLCLLVALDLAEQNDCLIVGDQATGYIVVPHAAALLSELEARCTRTRRTPSDWVRVFRISGEQAGMLAP